MRLVSVLAVFTAALAAASCNSNSDFVGHDGAEATIANETGSPAPLPKDVIYSAKALISGKLYARPSFDGTILAYFDTSQQLHIIDTTDNVFVKARLQQDTATHTGYIPKAILPEQAQP